MKILGLSDLTWLAMIAFVLSWTNSGFIFKVEKGGKLILAYSFSWLALLVASFFSDLVSILIGVAAMVVFAIFWKKMNDEYGPV